MTSQYIPNQQVPRASGAMAFMQQLKAVRKHIADACRKLAKEIEEIHAKGHYPTDYSLGFANGLIFADHHINMRQGAPKFYNRTTSIGHLPKPIALDPKDFAQMAKDQNAINDKFVAASESLHNAARDIVATLALMETDEKDDKKLRIQFSEALANLREKTLHMDTLAFGPEEEFAGTAPSPEPSTVAQDAVEHHE